MWILVLKTRLKTPPTKVAEGGGRVVKTEAERTPAEDELSLGNDKAVNTIFTAVDPNLFKMISKCTIVKEAWEILQTAYEGTAKVRMSKLQQLTTKWETA
ncbi:hypothetical protein LIER_40731 [Lithospermum erythrorhizon]|uniref:Gag-pol polyprotein n=1 Tax=Lithospermum erythrorhizon TaxID=34254 RepID=A0AAV3R070_LITER